MMKTTRLITEQEELAYRAVSGEFDGLSTAMAAQRMGVTPRRVQQLLASVKKKAPQLFPLLNAREAALLDLLNRGEMDAEIRLALHLTDGQLNATLRSLRKKHRLPDAGSVATVQYQEYMSDKIARKF